MDTNFINQLIVALANRPELSPKLTAFQEWGPIISPFLATAIIYLQLRGQEIRANLSRKESERVQADSVAKDIQTTKDKLDLSKENEGLKERIRGMEVAAATTAGMVAGAVVAKQPVQPPTQPNPYQA